MALNPQDAEWLAKRYAEAHWFLYMLQVPADGSIYIGVSTDVRRRLHEHNHSSRGAKYLASRGPRTGKEAAKLVAVWQYPDRSAAQTAEYAAKRRSRAEKLTIIEEFGQRTVIFLGGNPRADIVADPRFGRE